VSEQRPVIDRSSTGHRPVIDREECMGFGYCADALPGVFRVDDEGKAVVLDGGAAADELDAVVDDCPRGAISLVARPPGWS
jgi:ferredoxin